MKPEKFKSIHIDLEQEIYKINGNEEERVRSLSLTWDAKDGWVLDVTKDETYIAPNYPI